MENIFCKDLKLDFDVNLDPLKKIRDTYEKKDQMMMFPYSINDVDPRLVKWLDDLGMYISHQEVFYTPPGGKLPIHVDQYSYSNICKLNWILDAKGSQMVWFQPKPGTQLRYYTTPIGTQYLMFEPDEVNEIYRDEIKLGTIVNAGIPHSVYNDTNEGRWCLSHCPSLKTTRKMIEWPQAMEIFANFLK